MQEANGTGSSPQPCHSKFPADSVRSASLATDMIEEGVTAGEAANVDSVSNYLEKKVDDEGKEAVPKVNSLVEDDQEVLQQIAKMEKRLLNILEHGPPELTEHQNIRILEEQLSITRSDSMYLLLAPDETPGFC